MPDFAKTYIVLSSPSENQSKVSGAPTTATSSLIAVGRPKNWPSEGSGGKTSVTCVYEVVAKSVGAVVRVVDRISFLNSEVCNFIVFLSFDVSETSWCDVTWTVVFACLEFEWG